MITTTLLAPLSPQLLLHVAVYVPAVLTLMLLPVAVVLHLMVPLQPVAVNVAVSPLHKLVLVDEITGAAGFAPVPITISFDLGLTPHIVSHTTEYVPAALTVIVLLVAFVLHFNVPLQPVAVNVALSPVQIVVLSLVILGVVGLTPVRITIEFDALLVPQTVVQLAVYVPEVLTSILLPVTPVLHVKLPLQPVAVNVAFSPSQHTVLFDVITGAVGVVPVVMVTTLLAELSPHTLLHVAVYVPAVLTLMLLPVALVLHLIVPVQPVAVNVAVSPLHKLVLVDEITGAAGFAPVPITISFDLGLTPHIVSQTTEYVPDALTVIVLLVAFVLHFNVPLQAVAVNVALSPVQIVVLSLVILGVVGLTPVRITIEFDALLVPQTVVQLAVYVPDALTSILLPVTPVLHVKLPLQPVAVNVAFSPSQHTVLFDVITGAVGVVPVVMVTTLLAELSPHTLLHVAVYVPAVLTLMLLPVAVVLHLMVPIQPVALNVALSPLHKLVLVDEITGAAGFTPVPITISFDLGLTPHIVSHTTEYVPDALTVIVLLVAFVLHFNVPLQAVAVNVALSPAQIVVLSLVIVGVVGLTPVRITIEFDALLVPQTVVQLAVYVPDALTSILLPVTPVLHVKLPLQPVAVNVAFSPSQHTVLFDVITGAVGVVPVVMVTTLLAELSPHTLLHVAVYVPAVLTLMLLPVALVLHLMVPLQPVALNVAVSPLHKLVLVDEITGAAGFAPVPITISFDLGLTPHIVSHTTEYVPAALTVIVLLVAFVLHFNVPLQPVAVNVALSPVQIVVLSLVILGVVGLTPVRITIEFDALLVPQTVVQLAVYVPEVLTSILLPVTPVLHVKLPLQPVAVNVAFSPSQHTVLFDVITGAVGVVPVVMVTTLLAELSPHTLLHVAVYVPAVLTLMLLPVALVLHLIVPVQPVAVNVAVSPLHKLVLVDEITGAAGFAPVPITISFDLGLTPHIVSQTTEYVPDALTVIVLLVAFVLHFNVPLQAVAVNVALSPVQIVVLSLVILGVVGLTPVRITIEFDALLVPQTVVQLAVYVPDALTSILLPVTPVLHVKLPLQPVAVNVAFSPSQHTVLFDVITGAVGVVPVVMVTTLLAELSPHTLLHVAVYVPAVLTLMLLPVAVVLHLMVPTTTCCTQCRTFPITQACLSR